MMIRHGYPTFWRLGLMALLALLMTACGGGGGGTNDDKPAPPATELTASFTQQVSELDVSVDASGSTGDIANYQWDFGDGGTGVGQTSSHSYMAAGTYSVTLTVTDDKGATASKSVSVSVVKVNVAPTAAFSHSAKELVASFDASASSDSDGSIASYSWNFGDGATGTGKSASHSYAAAGTYSVTLTVTDDKGATTSKSVSVSVVKANVAPTAAFTHSETDLVANFDASSSSDSDGSIASYSWSFGDGTTGTGQSASHTYTAAGTYSVTLTVTDDKGATASQSVSVSLVAPNVAPTAAFTHSETDLVTNFDASSSSDSDGSIASYSWNFGDGATGSGKSASHSYAAAGTYTVTLTVTDDKGATASASGSVSVVSAVVMLSGMVIDDPLNGATVTAYDASSGVQLGTIISSEDGSYQLPLSASASSYLLVATGGTLHGQPFNGVMQALCQTTTECHITPYSTLITTLAQPYAGAMSVKLTAAIAQAKTMLGVSRDPFIREQENQDVSDVDLTLLRSELGDGSDIQIWANAVATDLNDGYAEDVASQMFIQAPKRQSSLVTVADFQVETAALPSFDSDTPTPENAFNVPLPTGTVVDYQIASLHTGIIGQGVSSEDYLTDIAYLQSLDFSAITDEDAPKVQNIIYQNFNIGSWRGQLNAQTTILARIFLAEPLLAMLPPDEKRRVAESIAQEPGFASTVAAYDDFIGNSLLVTESDIKTQILTLAGDAVAGLDQSQREASSRMAAKWLQPTEGTAASKRSLLKSAAATANLSLFGSMQMEYKPKGDAFNFASHSALWYGLQPFADFNKQGNWLDSLDTISLVEPGNAIPGLLGKKGTNIPATSLGSEFKSAVGTADMVIFRSNDNVSVDLPQLMNTLKFVEQLAKLGPAVSFGQPGKVVTSLKKIAGEKAATLKSLEDYATITKMLIDDAFIVSTLVCGEDDACQSRVDNLKSIYSALDSIFGPAISIPKGIDEIDSEAVLLKNKKAFFKIYFRSPRLDRTSYVKANDDKFRRSLRYYALELFLVDPVLSVTNTKMSEKDKFAIAHWLVNKENTKLAANQKKLGVNFIKLINSENMKLKEPAKLLSAIEEKAISYYSSIRNVAADNYMFYLQAVAINLGGDFVKSIALDIFSQFTPARYLQMASAGGTLGNMAWNWMVDPTAVRFRVQKLGEKSYTASLSLPPLQAIRYLSIPADDNGMISRSTESPTTFVYDNSIEIPLDSGNDSNSLLVMSGFKASLENQTVFKKMFDGAIKDFIDQDAVSMLWHVYKYPDIAAVGQAVPARTLATAFSNNYSVDKLKDTSWWSNNSTVKLEADNPLHVAVLGNEAAEHKAIDFTGYYRNQVGDESQYPLKHKTPGIFSDFTSIHIDTEQEHYQYDNTIHFYVLNDLSAQQQRLKSTAAVYQEEGYAELQLPLAAENWEWANDKSFFALFRYVVNGRYQYGSVLPFLSQPRWHDGLLTRAYAVPDGVDAKTAELLIFDDVTLAYAQQTQTSINNVVNAAVNYQVKSGQVPVIRLRLAELMASSEPLLTKDSDGDGMPDLTDSFPSDANYMFDQDQDAMPDEWEASYGLSPDDASDAYTDLDNDGQTNLQEFINGTDPGRAAFKLTGAVGDGQLTLNWPTQGSATPISLCVAQEPISDPYNCLTASGSSTRTLAAVTAPYTLSGLSNSQRYYLVLLAEPASGAPYVSSSLDLVPVKASLGKLNDTGITQCGDANSNILPCPVVDFPGQDAESGRDVSANDDSDGHAGFSFTKVSSSGEALAASAPEWSCVQDNVTGLLWEIHTDDGGLRDKDNTYSWYNPDATTNGGYAGTQNGGSCSGGISCDTQSYVAAVNAAGLCGYHDWRLPTVLELQGLVDYSIPKPGPSIDTNFFPDTRQNLYWSSSALAGDASYAWYVQFDNGYAFWYFKYNSYQLRLVRSEP